MKNDTGLKTLIWSLLFIYFCTFAIAKLNKNEFEEHKTKCPTYSKKWFIGSTMKEVRLAEGSPRKTYYEKENNCIVWVYSSEGILENQAQSFICFDNDNSTVYGYDDNADIFKAN